MNTLDFLEAGGVEELSEDKTRNLPYQARTSSPRALTSHITAFTKNLICKIVPYEMVSIFSNMQESKIEQKHSSN